MSPFLQLPLELRFVIYGHIAEAAPHNGHMSEYLGLYLSSRQVKTEFEAEYMRASEPYFTELADTLQGPDVLTIPTTITFATRQRFDLRMSSSIRALNFRTEMFFFAHGPQLPCRKAAPS